MFSNIVGAICTFAGTILGWILNNITEAKKHKAKLCFALGVSKEELISPECRTKTSLSGYTLVIYNVGQEPFLLERVRLFCKKKILADCIILDEDNAIMPFQKYIYELNQQEYDALLYHCKELNISRCKARAYSINNLKAVGRMDLFLIGVQAQFR